MVIMFAITGITSFVIPSYAMSIPIRIIRFAFMVMAATFGVYELTVGHILIVHLCKLSSFNIPYMSPIAPYNRDEQSDAILRFPFWFSGNRKTNRRQRP
ncbi:spore germination protein [Paenibacillus sp. LPE1-1-1.1]|uniref:spore germination protein n=1 Tax=Paenibacillus sp. LPE1-1-1.1 TaxID=3135230 RepID=UPI0034230123